MASDPDSEIVFALSSNSGGIESLSSGDSVGGGAIVTSVTAAPLIPQPSGRPASLRPAQDCVEVIDVDKPAVTRVPASHRHGEPPIAKSRVRSNTRSQSKTRTQPRVRKQSGSPERSGRPRKAANSVERLNISNIDNALKSAPTSTLEDDDLMGSSRFDISFSSHLPSHNGSYSVPRSGKSATGEELSEAIYQLMDEFCLDDETMQEMVKCIVTASPG